MPEFSRPVPVQRLADGDLAVTVTASEGEREALAQRFELLSLDHLSADVKLISQPGAISHRLSAVMRADAVQTCVITLEPVTTHIEATFERTYGAPEDSPPDTEVLVSDDDDPPEPIVDDVIDIGEAVAEQLSLELDPFPRAPGSVFGADQSADANAGEDAATDKPFAGLAEIRDKLGDR